MPPNFVGKLGAQACDAEGGCDAGVGVNFTTTSRRGSVRAADGGRSCRTRMHAIRLAFLWTDAWPYGFGFASSEQSLHAPARYSYGMRGTLARAQTIEFRIFHILTDGYNRGRNVTRFVPGR